jgi:asparagine synthase (glutamine-hydrolysing)
VLLSGGLDSSLVAALAARRSSHRLRTFTVTFPGHAGHDEGPHARLVATALGTAHTELRAEGALIDTLPALARHLDEPIADSAIVPTAELSRLVRQHVTVALGGDGSDELFGGYPHYQWMGRFAAARRMLPAPARAAAAWAAARRPVGTSRRHHLMGLTGEVGTSIAHVNLYFDCATRAALVPLLAGDAVNALPEAWRARLGAEAHDPRDRAMRADFLSTLPDGYLARVDRASMRVALEVRAPFLDADLVDFALREVPADLKVTRAGRKLLPQRLAARLLPPAFDRTRKQGFTMPLATWFDAGWDSFVTDTLHADPELFDSGSVGRLIHGQRRGRANIERLFSLTMLALWRREWGVGVG